MLDSLHPDFSPNIHRVSLESPETEFNVEKELRLREQYDNQVNILRTNNLLETLSTGEQGITAINHQEYPLPTYDQVKANLEAQRELLTTKTKQKFKKLLLVPFGLKLQTQIDAYGQALKQHHSQRKLLRAKFQPSDPDEPATLDQTTPVYQWDGYSNADTEGKLVYNPTSFDPDNHGGQTKTQLLGSVQTGWQILLVEERPDIPRADQGETLHNRPQLEAGQSPNDYLIALQTDPIYKGEAGLTPEAWLSLALTNLDEKNQVTDDHDGRGSQACLTGAYFSSDGLPCAFWDKRNAKAILNRDDPSDSVLYLGVQTSVRVPLDLRVSTSLQSLSSVPPMPEIRKF